MKKIFILFVILLSSCASRKVVVNKEEVKTKMDSVSNIKTSNTYIKENNVFVKESISELEYKPLDSLKPMVIDGKEYVNTIIKLKQSNKEAIDTSKVILIVTLNKKVVLKKRSNAKVINKNIKKEINYNIYIWIILIMVLLYGLRGHLRKRFPFIL